MSAGWLYVFLTLTGHNFWFTWAKITFEGSNEPSKCGLFEYWDKKSKFQTCPILPPYRGRNLTSCFVQNSVNPIKMRIYTHFTILIVAYVTRGDPCGHFDISTTTFAPMYAKLQSKDGCRGRYPPLCPFIKGWGCTLGEGCKLNSNFKQKWDMKFLKTSLESAWWVEAI